MENGLPSPRADAFPAGLRVLVVDDDPTWLKILEKMLKKCSYEVTTCCLARVALDMLRERKDGFDIVISDVNMPDMDGFKLLEHVGLEMDLPVIMMSVDGETSRVMRGVQHGACDYLLKPVRMKELQNIWQHVFRRKIHEAKDVESHDSNEDTRMMKVGADDFEELNFVLESDANCARKRKVSEHKEHDEHDFNDPSAGKKARVVWSVDLHQKFVNAVNQIGYDKVGPKKILDLMNVPGLTRENVASHLQKYRLYLSRLQKQNEPNSSFCGTKHLEFDAKDPPPKFELQSSITVQQTNQANSFGNSEKTSFPDVTSEIHDDDLKSVVSFSPATEVKKPFSVEDLDTFISANAHKVDMVMTQNTFKLPGQPWTSEISSRPDITYSLSGGYPNLEKPKLFQIQVDHRQRGALPADASTCNANRSKIEPSQLKPLYEAYKTGLLGHAPKAYEVDSILIHPVPESVTGGLESTRSEMNCQNGVTGWDLYQDLTLKNGVLLAASHDDLQLCSLQGNGFLENVGFNSMEFLDYHDTPSLTELPSDIYDQVRLSFDCPWEVTEYPLVDEGLFIV